MTVTRGVISRGDEPDSVWSFPGIADRGLLGDANEVAPLSAILHQ